MFAGHELGIVTLLALLEYLILGVMVGRARRTYGVEAPATTGNPDFERIYPRARQHARGSDRLHPGRLDILDGRAL